MSSSIHKVDLDEALLRLTRATNESSSSSSSLSLALAASPTTDTSSSSSRRRWKPGSDDSDNEDGDDGSPSSLHSRTSHTSSVLLTGWDETIGDDPDSQGWQQAQAVLSKSLTPHVLVHRSFVCGSSSTGDDHGGGGGDAVATNGGEVDRPQPSTSWKLSWKTSLAPHRIHQVATNEGGSVVAATTDNGTVSILRGRDGRVLATRRVVMASAPNTGGPSDCTGNAAEVSFVVVPSQNSTPASKSSRPANALLVSTPRGEGPALLVSNIQGGRLDDKENSVVAMATQAMNLHAIEIPSIPASDIHCMRGYYSSDSTSQGQADIRGDGWTKIRFVLLHGGNSDHDAAAMLALAEYDLEDQGCRLVAKNMRLGSGWEIDALVGLQVQPSTLLPPRALVAFVAHSGSNTKICWVDPDCCVDDGGPSTEIELVGDFLLTAGNRQDNPYEASFSSMPRALPLDIDGVRRPRILALEFAHAYRPEKAMAMIVAIQGTDHLEVQVVQGELVQDDNPNTLQSIRLGPVHLLYRIPMPTLMHSMSLCPLPSKTFGPYSFRSKISVGLNRPEEVYVFQTASLDGHHDGSAIGAIRLLIMKDAFAEARALVHQTGMEALLQDQFANFHPAEIALKRLHNLLERSTTVDEQWHECLTGLQRGAGHDKGRRVLLDAADRFMSWPQSEQEGPFSPSLPQTTVNQVLDGLSAFLETMGSVSEYFLDDDVPPWLTATYRKKLKGIEEKQNAIQYLATTLELKRSDSSSSSVTAEGSLKPQYTSVGSVNELFNCFVRNGRYVAAEQLWASSQRSKLTSETLVTAVLQIDHTVHPVLYSTLLNNILLRSLSINHELLPPILTWSCRMADEFDDTYADGLDRSIFLLEKIDRSTKQLRLRVHSSFSFYSPFVERWNRNTRDAPLQSKECAMNISEEFHFVDSSFASTNGPASSRQSEQDGLPDEERPNPTILELGQMKLGAQKARLGQVVSLRVSAIDENEECVDTKLRAARCLKLARSFGLTKDLTSLREFQHFGGSQQVAKELVRLYSLSSTTHEERYMRLVTDVRSFCDTSGASYEQALIIYAKELCSGKNTNPEAIEESASIARCCFSPISKCEITLIALRAALFCRFSPNWLTILSRDAIDWAAGDSSLRSELEEASRLLLIDGIVGRYCGDGAKELFHVDNPLHAIRLFDFVSKHLDHDSVLCDVLDLCEAFHHLSVEDGCSGLIQNAILKGKLEKAESFLVELYDRDGPSGHNVFSRVVTYCIEAIEDGASLLGYFPVQADNDVGLVLRRQEIENVTTAACDLTKIGLRRIQTTISTRYRNIFAESFADKSKLDHLSQDLCRLRALQRDHQIFLSLTDLRDPKATVDVASKLLAGLANTFEEGKSHAGSAVATKAKRACSLLAGSIEESELLFTSAVTSACQLVWRSNELECFEFLSSLGILEASRSNLSARCCLAVALSYCMRSTKRVGSRDLNDNMKGLIMASSLLQDYIVSNCPGKLLGVATSLSDLCDIVSQVLTRADEGVGEQLDRFRKQLLEKAAEKRWSFALSNTASKTVIGDSLRLSKPILHPTWYVGDGLLLPPEEALAKGIEYCKQSMGLQMMDESSHGIQSFASNRGAQSLALLIQAHSTMTQACRFRTTPTFDDLWEFTDRVCIGLAERSLGGTGNGITSGVVDSQLATSFLLCLPLKVAFKVYRSSLPTAINTRDFERVVTLAVVGKVAGSEDSIMSPTGASLGNWTRQNKFVSQCDRLATKASWWNVLDMYNLNFDPHLFEDRNTGKETSNSLPAKQDVEATYAASMIPTLISNMAKKGDDTEKTLDVVTQYADAFYLPRDLPILFYIQYLLRPEDSKIEVDVGKPILGTGLSATNAAVISLLRRLDSSSKRIKILRKCLILHEKQSNCVDYELLSVILSLYQAELSAVLSSGDVSHNNGNENMNNLLVEMELVDRRRDALAILSSYFQGDKRATRPSFSRFFHPLCESIGGNSFAMNNPPRSRILGWESPPSADCSFDPLDPLDDTLRSSLSSATTSALAPLCIPLGVPRGYVRARSLISRFQKSKMEGASLPPFEDDVLLMLSQLRAASDIAELLEWCSLQYDLQHADKLKCLDHALTYAIKASNEAEGHVERESFALARVKRITSSKALLENRVEVNQILRTSETSCSRVLFKLTERLESQVWNKSEFVPEIFVDTLFNEASLLAADATLCDKESLSIGQFRYFSHLIHRVAKCIADKYSHVQPGYLARRLSRRWLFRGDGQLNEAGKEEHEKMIPLVSHNLLIPDIDEEDTMDFQMDLSILNEASNWASGIKTEHSSLSIRGKEKLTSEEEPSSLEPTSIREISELSSQRSSLRIVFVMAYAEGYYGPFSGDSSHGDNVENIKPSLNPGPTSAKSKRRGLLSKLKSSRTNDQHDSVLEHCRELLRIVFAQPSSVDVVIKGLNSSFDSVSVNGSNRSSPSTITFAMRHRCLRSASFLVPQEALEEVLSEDEFFPNTSVASLKMCSFGSFVAKEVEEMGLPIPHTDLFQLSQMHFPSYARTLWRHHRDSKGSKGRLLLLILQMYLKDPISDFAFFLSILKEMETLSLPRTLLMACESILRYMDKIGPDNQESFVKDTGTEICGVVTLLFQLVSADLNRSIGCNGVGADHGSTVKTLSRLGNIVVAFAKTSASAQQILTLFSQRLLDTIVACKTHEERCGFQEVLEQSLSHLGDKKIQKELRDRCSRYIPIDTCSTTFHCIGSGDRDDPSIILSLSNESKPFESKN